MDDHVSEREVVQGDARPLDRSGAHHRDRERIVSVSKNAGEKRRQQIKLSLCPRPTLRPKRVALRAPQGFAPAGDTVMNHPRVGPKEKIKRGQIKLTETVVPSTDFFHRSSDWQTPNAAPPCRGSASASPSGPRSGPREVEWPFERPRSCRCRPPDLPPIASL